MGGWWRERHETKSQGEQWKVDEISQLNKTYDKMDTYCAAIYKSQNYIKKKYVNRHIILAVLIYNLLLKRYR